MEKGEINKLKETIRHQHKIVQKLYADLEEEREASATAASEALSMILRLQGEKAAEKMEACQYKRVAEEKMRHAEESLVIFEDLIYQKEMEIASLKLQVQDFTDKFLGIVSDCSKDEVKHLGNPHSEVTNSFQHEKRPNGIGRRRSLPVLQFKELFSQIDNIDREPLSSRTTYLPALKTDESSDKVYQLSAREYYGGLYRNLSVTSKEKLTTDSSCCSPQDGEIKENTSYSSHARNVEEDILSQCGYSNNILDRTSKAGFVAAKKKCLSFMMHSGISNKNCSPSTPEVDCRVDAKAVLRSSSRSINPENSSDFEGSSSSCMETLSRVNNTSSANTHDIYEIPQSEHWRQHMQCSIPDKFQSPNSLSDYSKNDELLKKATLESHYGIKSFAPRKEIIASDDCRPLGNSTSVISSPRFQIEQLEKRLEAIEKEIKITQSLSFDRENEQLKLLREMHVQLNQMISYERDKKSQKNSSSESSDTLMMVPLMEAMLSFSI